MNQYFAGLFNNDFDRDTLKVFLGVVTVGLVNLVCLPVLTRLFTPEVFGQLQFILACAAVLSVFGTLQYELAIVLPDDPVKSGHVLVLCVLILAVVFTIIFLSGFLFSDSLHELLKPASELSDLWLIPVLMFTTVLFNLGQSMLVAAKSFTRYSMNNVIQTSVFNISAIVGGYVNPVILSLLIGYFLSHTVSSVYALKNQLARVIQDFDPAVMKYLVVEYRRFPLVTTTSVLVNTIAMHIPVFLFSAYYGMEILGLYMISARILDIPLNLLRGSITQVYFQAASRAYNRGINELIAIYKSTQVRLGLMALGVLLTILFLDRWIPAFLGSGWEQTSQIVKVLLVWKLFEFLHAPIGHTWSIIKADTIAFVMRLFSIIARFLSIYIFRDDFNSAIVSFSIVSGLYYLGMNGFLFYLLKRRERCLS